MPITSGCSHLPRLTLEPPSIRSWLAEPSCWSILQEDSWRRTRAVEAQLATVHCVGRRFLNGFWMVSDWFLSDRCMSMYVYVWSMSIKINGICMSMSIKTCSCVQYQHDGWCWVAILEWSTYVYEKWVSFEVGLQKGVCWKRLWLMLVIDDEFALIS